ncbi:MAG: hypothetical protein JSU65_12505 [Candidatus Zixiibacteriota bacterium]|nr:MAG: hypothetical protein JSU65_12505 [candidate division Zixibacteria bacterium]
MQPPEVEYIRDQIANHVAEFTTLESGDLFDSGLIRFLPYDEAATIQERAIAVPFDIPIPKSQEEPYKVRFNDTDLTLWNRITPPSDNSWRAIPDGSAPLWYTNRFGSLIPAWNLFGNLFYLLTFGEEKESSQKDLHGRFAASFSPRAKYGLLEIPAFNEAVAALVGACAGLRDSGQPAFNIDGLIGPPVISLSHDCDILRGNDIWTQAVRLVRIFRPLVKMRLPGISNSWWIMRNAVAPRAFYFDNATGMIDLERCFGYRSTFYMLNGRSGRFGARSGLAVIPELLKEIPPEWDIGVHYNYDTFLNDERFSAQMEQLQEVTDSDIVVGRAHYLRFDPEKSFSFLQKHGISIDESSGYSDMIGYRNGIAGCFQVYDTVLKRPLEIWELPMTIMDTTLVRQYGPESITRFSQLLYHLSRVGGALSVSFHPGQFFNPEHKQMLGVYHRMLIECRQTGALAKTARSHVDSIA